MVSERLPVEERVRRLEEWAAEMEKWAAEGSRVFDSLDLLAKKDAQIREPVLWLYGVFWFFLGALVMSLL